MAEVRRGDVVLIRYRGLSADGAVFGTAEGSEPLQLTVGSDKAIEGLNRAVLGMQAGERKTVTVPPEQGFGPHEPGRVYQVRRAALPESVRIGDRLSGQAGNAVVPVWVTALDEDFATVDANHPLAGQIVVLEIELVAIRPEEQSRTRKKIHVGNLPRSFTSADLQGLFSAYGAVRSVELITHRPTSRSRGFGLVEMETQQATREAVRALNGYAVQGQTLTVSEAQGQTAQHAGSLSGRFGRGPNRRGLRRRH